MRINIGAANKRRLLPQLLKPCAANVAPIESLHPRLVIDETMNAQEETPRTPTTISYIPPNSPLPEPMEQDDPLQGNDDVINRCRESLARNSTKLSDLATSESNDTAQVINDPVNAQGALQTAVGYRPLFNMSQLNAAAANNQSLNPAPPR